MSYNYDALRHPIIVDVETAAHPCAADFIEPLDLSGITAGKNLRDPIKIAEDVARRRAEAIDEYAQKIGKASLDFNLSRIVALGWSVDGGETVDALVCQNETEEADVLEVFWKASEGRLLLGFYARTFDAPTLVTRSRLLNVLARDINLARYGKGSVIDLYEILTFDELRAEKLMPRKLATFCQRYGIPVDDPIDGSMIGQLVAEEKWGDILEHVTSDVRLTGKLARRLGVLSDTPVEVL